MVHLTDYIAAPDNLTGIDFPDIFQVSENEVNSFQLQVASSRFKDLKSSVAMLGKLADEQQISSVETLDDLAPLLFSHTVYKAYPLSYLEKGNYQGLTKFLGRLTSHDLSGMDLSNVDSIDSWIAALETQTSLKICHTSGTTGKLSILPRTETNWINLIKMWQRMFLSWRKEQFGDIGSGDIPYLYPYYRHGALSHIRCADTIATHFAGESNSLFMNPGRLSADVASLAGRIKRAESLGESVDFTISNSLKRRRDQFIDDQKNLANNMQQFFEEAVEKYRGRQVFFSGPWSLLLDAAESGKQKGLSSVFAPNTLILTGGGLKGRSMPEGWRETICDFIGVDTFFEIYGMSEVQVISPICEKNHYHIHPALIPFVLDPDTGVPLPREGIQKGRFAFFDLLADCYWGGFVTGDEVTLHWWDSPCGCGHKGPHLEHEITRYSEQQGGDDKLNCAGAPEAQSKAIDFLTNIQ